MADKSAEQRVSTTCCIQQMQIFHVLQILHLPHQRITTSLEKALYCSKKCTLVFSLPQLDLTGRFSIEVDIENLLWSI